MLSVIRFATRRLFLLSISFLLANPVFAGTVVEQTVTGKRNNVRFSTKYSWQIDGKKFLLNVKSDENNTQYLFNGRVLYVCSALDKAQLAFLEKNNINHPIILEKFKKGACQTVPANFLARFFLSPIEAVNSIDRTDGFRITLQMKSYDESQSEPTSNKCKNPRQRSYKMEKRVSAEEKTIQFEASEITCRNPSITWRDGIWREVSKTMLRQSGGKDLLEILKQDHKNSVGLVVSGQIATKRIDQNGSSEFDQEVVTNTIKSKSFTSKDFRIPFGYEIFTPETLANELASLSPKKSRKSKSDEDPIASILLCAISGSFFCLK